MWCWKKWWKIFKLFFKLQTLNYWNFSRGIEGGKSADFWRILKPKCSYVISRSDALPAEQRRVTHWWGCHVPGPHTFKVFMVLDVNSNFVYFQHNVFIRTPQWEFSSLITTIILKKRLVKKIFLFHTYRNYHKQVWTATETYTKWVKEILEADHSLSCI